MFEKAAEEYYYKTYPVTLNIGEEERKKEVTDIFIKGAEFGYNKAFVEADKNLKAVVADFNKANEWHKDLPTEDVILAIIEVEDCGYLLCEYRKGVWYDKGSSAVCKDWITRNIKSWKEIELPKEIE